MKNVVVIGICFVIFVMEVKNFFDVIILWMNFVFFDVCSVMKMDCYDVICVLINRSDVMSF